MPHFVILDNPSHVISTTTIALSYQLPYRWSGPGRPIQHTIRLKIFFLPQGQRSLRGGSQYQSGQKNTVCFEKHPCLISSPAVGGLQPLSQQPRPESPKPRLPGSTGNSRGGMLPAIAVSSHCLEEEKQGGEHILRQSGDG